MELILLPGNSPINKEWTEDVEKKLNELFEFDSTFLLEYLHWESGEELISIDKELERLVEHTKSKENYAIFAKSAGTLLTLKGIYSQVLHPQFCIFVGTAVDWGRSNKFDIDTWIKNYKTPTLFIQKSQDPSFSYEKLKSLIEVAAVQNYKLVEIPGDTHHYEDLVLLKNETEAFILAHQS